MDLMPCYFCARVRGANRDAVTPDVKAKNVEEGLAMARTIQAEFPSIKLYIPHDHETMIDILWRWDYLSSGDIIEASCEIINRCQLLIVWTGRGISGGMAQEMAYARQNHIPVFEFEEWNDYAKERLARTLSDIRIKMEM